MKRHWIMPSWVDPRVLILIFFLFMIFFALTDPVFARRPLQIVCAVLTCVLFDLYFSRRHTGKYIFPLSGIVTSMGVFLLVDSIFLWPFVLTAALSVLSKHILKYQGSHIFNPNNFGLLVVALAFPEFVSLNIMRWGGNLFWIVTLLTLGLIITVLVNRWLISVSYYGFFFAIAGLRALLLDHNFLVSTLSLFGPGMQLFVFFMITDPKTTPSTPRQQLFFGFTLALIDNLLRMQHYKLAPLFAVFICCLAYAVLVPVQKTTKQRDWRLSYV